MPVPARADATGTHPARPGSGIFYGWVIVWAGFLVGLVGIGARYSYGVFLKSIETEFTLGRGAASGIFSVYMLLCCLLAAAGGWALDRYGPRRLGVALAAFTGLSLFLTGRARAPWQLFVTYSLLLSLGTGPIYGLINTTTSRWFLRKRGLAVGITSSGGGVGAIVLAPLASYLITRYDWRTAFGVLGGASTVLMAGAALLLIKDPRAAGCFPDGVKADPVPGETIGDLAVGDGGQSPAQALRSRWFWLLASSWLLLSLSLHMVLIHVVAYAAGLGVKALEAALILSLIGFANIPGRLVVGRLSDVLGTRALGVLCPLVQCGALIWLIGARQLWALYAFALAFGFLWGGAGTITTVLTVEVFGTRSLGTIMGLMSSAWAVGAAVGPAIGGWTFDLTGHYAGAFGAGAGGLVVAAVLLGLIGGAPRAEVHPAS